MKRLTEKTVLVGLVIACLLATWPTSISPVLLTDTTDGVVREPSELGMTTGLPPSMVDTHEFVVPKSIPITLVIAHFLLINRINIFRLFDQCWLRF
jgi:hypothetical protein